jgi:uncharacterized protein
MKTTVISLEDLKRSLKKQPDKLPMFERTPESYSKFKIERTGEYFHYSNFDNGIYDQDLNPVSTVTEPDSIYLQNIGETRSLKKSSKPTWIRILLGHACNYSCDYCLQKDIGNLDERGKITTTDQFIEQLGKLDLSNLKKIDLWGGETLLYWKTIMPVMEAFDREDISWYIPTNGTTLLMKHVEFFSKLKGKVELGISHDGPGHVRLRGPEFLHKKVEVLRALQQHDNIRFSFNPTITDSNYDLFAINKFFWDFATANGIKTDELGIGYTMVYNHDYEDNHNSGGHVVHGETLDKFRTIIQDFLKANTEQFLHKQDRQIIKNDLYTGGMGVLPYIQTLKKQVLPTITTGCGVDDQDVLSVDISGNVRTCPHVDESFISGHLEDIPNVKLKNLDLARYERHCKSCPVFRLCKSTCPIEVPDDVFYSNCNISKIWYRGIQDEAFSILFNSEVTLVENKS